MINCKQIRQLYLSITAKLDNSAFWKAVSDLPHLEELTIPECSVMHQGSKDKDLDLSKELQGLWNACSRLKTLEIGYFHCHPDDMRLEEFDWDKPGLAVPSMISNETFPYLRCLRLIQSDASNVSQVMFITRCSNLEVLKWNPDSSEDTATAIGNLCRYFEEGNSPNLKSLEFSQDQEDTIIADVLRSLDGRALQELDLSDTEFDTRAHKELQRFFPTLRVLNLSGCFHLPSSNALEIILSCPLLEKLAVYQIHAEDLDPARSWPCHKTLRSLNASFNLALKSGSSGRTGKSMTTKKELCERVYSTLAHLNQLEYLAIDDDYRDVDEEDEGYIPLEIDLSKGFGKLAGLKKLKHFQMGDIALLVKQRELYWMLANWSKSNSIIDCPNRNDVFTRVLTAKKNEL
ncbi:hypothetical protein BGZ49_003199 [Haplosporangium sp. Z 27]|nr:hypothetical protein BGZ49_003199 [Haplosporangium sp. Z 27]